MAREAVATESLPIEESSEMGPIARWVVNHDDSWLFIISYVGLAVVLAFFSLFWLFVVVMVHFAFEWFKQSLIHDSTGMVVGETLWELKLDFGLIAFALALTLYLPYAFGVLGLGAASRAAVGAQAAARGGTRIAAVQRAVRVVLLSLDDLILMLRAAITARNDEGFVGGSSVDKDDDRGPIKNSLEDGPQERSWSRPWSWGDIGSLTFSLVSLLLIFVAPYITGETFGSTLSIILEEIYPLP